ncbi:MAG: ABC transporter ATP-binding protein [Ignavibacteriaceae bacterium]|nr:ABC transporter ATP-binding protein [Ignavibacteriaceae bacterium]
MSSYSVVAENLNKSFGRRLIFTNLNFNFSDNGIFGITGPNGSGKSTLIKIIAGVNTATHGKIIHQHDGQKIVPEKLHNYIGFVSPYLFLYDEFTAWENLSYTSDIREIKLNIERVEYLLNEFLLYNRRNDDVKTYSSGMKQRLKFIFALMHQPQLIILDEPTSNLDDSGKESVYKIIEEEGKENIVLIASNEKQDLALCNSTLAIEDYKNQTENRI